MSKENKKLLLVSLGLFLISGIMLFFKIRELRAELLMSISGKVIDYETGKGIPNISVIIEPYHWATTDKDGNFTIKDVPEGRYKIDIASTVSTIAEYYVPHSYPEYIEVPRGKNVVGVKIYLRKGATASGRVLAEDGVTPIKGAWVDVISYETNFYGDISALYSHSGSLKSKVTFLTDEEGRFKVKGLLEGFSFDLLIMAYGYADEWRRGLKVRYGEELNVGDIIMGRRSRSVIRGKVYSSKDMTPMVGAEIWISKMATTIKKMEESDGGWALTDSKGEFEIKGLTPGYYNIDAVLSDEDEKKYYAERIFDFYISESKENYVEIKAIPREEESNSSILEPRKTNFLKASIFPAFLFLLNGLPSIDMSCRCVYGPPGGSDHNRACEMILKNKSNLPTDVIGCPEVPTECHKENCEKDKKYKIVCEECSQFYEEGTPVPLCGYAR